MVTEISVLIDLTYLCLGDFLASLDDEMRRVDETLHNFRMKHPIALIFEINSVYVIIYIYI